MASSVAALRERVKHCSAELMRAEQDMRLAEDPKSRSSYELIAFAWDQLGQMAAAELLYRKAASLRLAEQRKARDARRGY